jgi:hypothetical protein
VVAEAVAVVGAEAAATAVAGAGEEEATGKFER